MMSNLNMHGLHHRCALLSVFLPVGSIEHEKGALHVHVFLRTKLLQLAYIKFIIIKLQVQINLMHEKNCVDYSCEISVHLHSSKNHE